MRGRLVRGLAGLSLLTLLACGGGTQGGDPVASRSFGLVDAGGAPLTTAPASGSPAAIVQVAIQFKFDVPVDPPTVVAYAVDELDATMSGTPVVMDNPTLNDFSAEFPVPDNPLKTEKTYRVYITARDLAGNGLVFTNLSGTFKQSGKP